MNFTIEAIYTLHLMNHFSDDLMFLPCPNDDLGRREQLKVTVEQGYKDLEKMGLMINHEPTDDCIRYGLYLSEYHNSLEHVRVDLSYFCAPAVDKAGYQSVVIRKVDESHYAIERVFNLIFLSLLISTHPILNHLEDKQKDYLKSSWDLCAYGRLMAYYGDSEAIHVTVELSNKIIQDSLYLEKDTGIYEYNLQKEMIRSIDALDLQHQLIRNLKVKE